MLIKILGKSEYHKSFRLLGYEAGDGADDLGFALSQQNCLPYLQELWAVLEAEES